MRTKPARNDPLRIVPVSPLQSSLVSSFQLILVFRGVVFFSEGERGVSRSSLKGRDDKSVDGVEEGEGEGEEKRRRRLKRRGGMKWRAE